MGCFLACFGGDKDRKQQQRRRAVKRSSPIRQRSSPSLHSVNQSYKPLQLSPPPKKLITEVDSIPVSELRENQDQGRKKVSFDLNVKTYEDVSIHEERWDEEEKEQVNEEKKPEDVEGKASPSLGVYPLNHRYQNCTSSDDEGEEDEDELDDCDFSDEEEDNEFDIKEYEEESYESFFSLPMKKEKQQDFQEVNSPIPVRASSPDREPTVIEVTARDRSQYVHSVLNPVENITKWKEVKAQKALVRNVNKENIVNSEIGSNMFKVSKPQKLFDSKPSTDYNTKEDILVDASLSTWLVSSENSHKEDRPQESTSSVQSNSPVSREDRPILGALTVEDLKHSSATSSPRKSPSRSPDDIPILGTVGSYWNSEASSHAKGTPNTTSKYREDKKVNWHSTPFEVRLERAMNKDAIAAKACLA